MGLGGRDPIHPLLPPLPAPQATLTGSPLASFPPRLLLLLLPTPLPPPTPSPHFPLGLRSLLPDCVWWADSKLHGWLRAPLLIGLESNMLNLLPGSLGLGKGGESGSQVGSPPPPARPPPSVV